MNEQYIQVSISEGRSVTAVTTWPETESEGWLFVYAPGAGSNINDAFGKYACHHLVERGMTAVRFQFPYMEARKRYPDPPNVLEATWRKVIGAVRADGLKLVVGGRSMGGRIASQVVAQGETVDALVLFAYPLHPPGSQSKWRDGHFPAVSVPTLFCSGERDAFGTPDELRLAASKVARSRIHLREAADHGFSVPKSSGCTREDVWLEAVTALLDWLG